MLLVRIITIEFVALNKERFPNGENGNLTNQL